MWVYIYRKNRTNNHNNNEAHTHSPSHIKGVCVLAVVRSFSLGFFVSFRLTKAEPEGCWPEKRGRLLILDEMSQRSQLRMWKRRICISLGLGFPHHHHQPDGCYPII